MRRMGTRRRYDAPLDFLPAMAGADGVIRGPAGSGRVASVAQDDVATLSVAVLTEASGHAGASYDLTGPEALSPRARRTLRPPGRWTPGAAPT